MLFVLFLFRCLVLGKISCHINIGKVTECAVCLNFYVKLTTYQKTVSVLKIRNATVVYHISFI